MIFLEHESVNDNFIKYKWLSCNKNYSNIIDEEIKKRFLKKCIWKMCLKIYYMDPAKFLSTPGFVWQAALRIIKVKFELLIGIYMLSMAEKVIRGEIRHTIDQYAKPNNKYMKDYDQNKETCYHKY